VVDDGTTLYGGGRQLYPLLYPATSGQPARHAEREAFGVLELTLHEDSYTYAWRSAPGQPTFEDTGTVACS
jgi:hypothetical protein